MHALLLTLVLAQAPAPDLDHGLMLWFAMNCAEATPQFPAQGPTLVLPAPRSEQRDGGWVTVWAAKELTRCALPRSRPQDFVEIARGLTRLPPAELGATLEFPPEYTEHSGFTALTGEKFLERVAPPAMPAYSARWLRQVFKALYRPPTGKLDGVSTQLVYDVVAKDTVRREARRWQFVLQTLTPARRLALARSYAREVKRAGASFDAWTYLTGVQKAELGPQAQWGDERVLGTILRRSLDGTLPTVLQLWQQVIDAYDPEFSRELGAGLKG